MGLIPSYCKLLVSLHKRIGFRGPLLTLGNQDIWASYDDLCSYMKEFDCAPAPASIRSHTSNYFRANGFKDFVHAQTFFEMLAIDGYADLDKFDLDSPEILHDLNKPVPSELYDKFNLIIDGGTIEHIFDVRQVMENLVRMSRVGGWIIHITPSSNYIDHGFYSASPCLFFDFYHANGFDDFVCYLVQVDPKNMRARCPYFEYYAGMDLSKRLDPRKVTAVFFAAKKIRQQKLVIPTQGSYRPAVANDHVSLTERFLPAFVLPLVKPVRPFLGVIRRAFIQNKTI